MIIFFVEVMQQAVVLHKKGIRSYTSLKTFGKEKEPEDESEAQESGERESLLGSSSSSSAGHQLNLHIIGKKNSNQSVYLIGRLFLQPWVRNIFDFCVFFHFISILISYILAASEAWGLVRNTPNEKIIISETGVWGGSQL